MKIGYLMQSGVPDMRHYPLSGPANHVKHVFSELLDLGHQVRLLAFMDGKIWLSDDLKVFEPISIPWLDKGLVRLLERVIRRVQSELRLPYLALFESLRFAWACRKVLSGYDFLYERMGWMGYGGALAANWLRIPLILEVNGDHLSELEMLGMMPHGSQLGLSISLVKWAVNQVTHVVATGDGWRSRFMERWGISSDKVSVIENGSEIVTLLSREQLRVFSVVNSSENVTVIYVGAFEPWHGLTILIEAVAKAISRGVLLKLVLVGSGSQGDFIKQMIFELGIVGYVVITGQLPPHEFAAYLEQADIGVSPYCGRVEYSGLKLLDYKAAGLAVIASGECDQPAVLKHGSTGWIVPPCDKDALCEAIVQLATNVDLRHSLGRQARIEAETYNSWKYTAEQLEQVFIKVVATFSSKFV